MRHSLLAFVFITIALLQIHAQNGPNPENDYYQLTEDSQDNILDVVANDDFGMYGPNGSVLLIRMPRHGLAIVDVATTPFDPTDDFVLYSPATNYFGLDTFTYDICDSMSNCRRARAVLEISNVNDPIFAVEDEITILENELAVSIDVLQNDLFSDGYSDGSLEVIQAPRNGLVRPIGQRLNVDKNKISYTTPPNFVGMDTLTYQITDNDGDLDTAQVIIHIIPGKPYYRFSDTWASWSVISTDFDFYPFYFNEKYHLIGDTIINSVRYSKIYHGDELMAAVREDDFRRIYLYVLHEEFYPVVYNAEALPIGEYLWYDFNVVPGDTLVLLDDLELACQTLDTIMVDDQIRSQWFFQPNPVEAFYFYWIEGIGGPGGPLNAIGDYFELAVELICYEDDEIFYHRFTNYPDCDFINTTQIERAEINIFPSIVYRGEPIQIDLANTEDIEVYIFNQFGELQTASSKATSILTTELLSAGLYYLTLVSESKSIGVGKFIVLE